MTIVSADYILKCDEKFTILRDSAVCFDKKIVEIAPVEELKKKYPSVDVIDEGKNSILMPGLINTHLHLEFSSNTTTLRYGDFISWLNSVISYRDELQQSCTKEKMDETVKNMLKSGTTTIGAISSFGKDLDSLNDSKINVIYFNEILGSNPSTVDIIYNDFLNRLYDSLEYKSQRFIPAISVHSPYSTHPIVAKKALEVAKKMDMIVSTHFMESRAEREWLDKSDGDFKNFFKKFAPNSKPVNNPIEFIDLFKGQKKVLFTHLNYATQQEIELIENFATITHCPVSNRLLGNKRLEIEKIKKITVATDGLSSNNSLNLWDELRAALMIHFLADIRLLSKRLIKSVTKDAGFSIGLKKGELTEGYDADIISVELSDGVKDLDDLALFLILHTKKVKKLFISGEEIL